MKKSLRALLLFFLSAFPCKEGFSSSLLDDLLLLKKVNEEIYWHFPIHHNHLLVSGYMMMPSARSAKEGEAAAQFQYSSPYSIWSACFSPFHNIEVSTNYRLLHGVDDPVLSPYGYGERSDKGANIKFVIARPEDSGYCLPGIAIGLEDFFGTKTYNASYIVATQVFKPLNAEVSLGYADRRIQGLFGGLLWRPFYNHPESLLSPLSLLMEYDATQYSDAKWEPHPESREQKTPWNVGIGYKLNNISLNASWMRGKEFSIGGSISGNIGTFSSLLPKTKDPLPYTRPLLHEKIGEGRSLEQFAEQLKNAFSAQKIELLAILQDNCGNLQLVIENRAWLDSQCLKKRVIHLVGALVPESFEYVSVFIEADGIFSHRFTIPTATAREFLFCRKGYYEVQIQAPDKDLCFYPTGKKLFWQNRPLACPYIEPDIHNLFGSSKGKYKYSIGIAPGVEGYLPGNWYYNLKTGFVLLSDLKGVSDYDLLNPSQVINVRSDKVRFYKKRGLTLHELYLQKNWNLGGPFFSRFSFGYFEQMYAGVATEFLFYPIESCFALGIEGAALMKREPGGFDLTRKIRKLEGYTPTYPHLCPIQYFATLYYQNDPLGIEASLKGGQFLARDMGARLEVTKTFASGIKAGLWYTHTNAKDILNGENYRDKGVILSIPLELFSTCSQKKKAEQRLAAWQRDVGQIAFTGKPLYNTLRTERFR